MPTLYNQTNRQLSWPMSGKTYTCEPWGAVDVPEKLVPFCKQYGITIDVVPVAPEVRAQRRVTEQAEEAKADAIKALKAEADNAKAQAAKATEEVATMQQKLEQAHRSSIELSDQLNVAKRIADEALADKKAAEELLSETARQATEAEERAIRAEALLEQERRPPRDAKVPKQAGARG